MCQPLGYINPQDLYEPEDNSRAVYLVQDGEMGPFTDRAQEVGAQLTLVRQFEAVSLYTSDRQLMQPPQETPQS